MTHIYTSPVIFSAAMIEALLSGRKTQTRRIITSQWANVAMHFHMGHEVYLWARENFSAGAGYQGVKPREIPGFAKFHYWADGNPTEGNWTKQWPSIHMPAQASRISLKVTDVRKQRLEEIVDDDAKAEGAPYVLGAHSKWLSNAHRIDFADSKSYREGFSNLWDSLHGQKPGESWDDNPEVMAITFEVIERNINAIVEERAAA